MIKGSKKMKKTENNEKDAYGCEYKE